MSAEQQTTFGPALSGDRVEISTDGRLVRPLLALPAAIVDECKWRFTAEAIDLSAVDAANVSMLDLHVPSDAFDVYDRSADGDLVTACNLGTFRAPLATVRYGARSADPVVFSMDRTRTRITTKRTYDATTVERTDAFLNLDPDSVRKEPEVPTLEYSWQTTLDTRAFKDVLDGFDEAHDAALFREVDGSLVMEATVRGDGGSSEGAYAVVDSAVDSARDDPIDGAESMFSLDYLTTIATGLQQALVDEVAIYWDDEFPIKIEFDRGGDDLVYSGMYIVSPRLRPEGGD